MKIICVHLLRPRKTIFFYFFLFSLNLKLDVKLVLCWFGVTITVIVIRVLLFFHLWPSRFRNKSNN